MRSDGLMPSKLNLGPQFCIVKHIFCCFYILSGEESKKSPVGEESKKFVWGGIKKISNSLSSQ